MLRFSPLLVAISLMLAMAPVRACMNEYRPNMAVMERSESLYNMLTVRRTVEPWELRRDRLRALTAGGDFRVKNDLATALCHTGEAQEAVKLLREIEAEKPDLYFTAANLGTAYELTGNDREALRWIQRGIELNPEGHNGTEWLHVRILKAKLALAENPQWLATHSILEDAAAGTGLIGANAVGNQGQKLTPDQVKAALLYQLHERLQFVPAPDIIVGALLLDLGALVAYEPLGVGAADAIFTLATSYLNALPVDHILRRRARSEMSRADEALMAHKNARTPMGWLAVGVSLFGVYFVWRVYRRLT